MDAAPVRLYEMTRILKELWLTGPRCLQFRGRIAFK